MEPVKTETVKPKKEIIVFTDGSCNQKTGRGGYAVVFPDFPERNISKHLPKTTNNRAEYLAVIAALNAFPSDNLVIHTDSELLVKTINSWILTWKKNNWLKYNNQPIKNPDLVKQLYQLVYVSPKRTVVVRHVRAHTGKNDYFSKYNDLADTLAKAAGHQRT